MARIGAWLVAGTVLLVVGVYAGLVAVNWSDEAPSADAKQLQRIILDRPVVADADNAYVLTLGLAAPRDQPPLELGRTRKQFLDNIRPDSGAEASYFPGADVEYRASRSQAIRDLAEACRRGDEACLQPLRSDPALVKRWLESEAWLLDRYLQLVRLGQWVETVPTVPHAPLPRYQQSMDAQQLLLMKAWQLARDADGDGTRALLQQDLSYWRMVLRSSDMLITKMIAAAAIDRNFSLGNLALRELHGAGVDAAPPGLWRVPISREERSMRRALAGEWFFMSAALESMQAEQGAAEPSTRARLSDWLLRPMLNMQATRNLHAAHMVHVASDLDVDYPRLPQAALGLERTGEGTQWQFRAYNPVGHMLVQAAAGPDYANYGVRVSDLEGTRRAALLAAELRAGGADATDPSARIRSTALKDPYTDHPLQWDADARSVVFNGLGKGERSRHAMVL
ncbi:MAG TPA: hypothetical protein VIT90_18155 [Lysobacter sp.]